MNWNDWVYGWHEAALEARWYRLAWIPFVYDSYRLVGID